MAETLIYQSDSVFTGWGHNSALNFSTNHTVDGEDGWLLYEGDGTTSGQLQRFSTTELGKVYRLRARCYCYTMPGGFIRVGPNATTGTYTTVSDLPIGVEFELDTGEMPAWDLSENLRIGGLGTMHFALKDIRLYEVTADSLDPSSTAIDVGSVEVGQNGTANLTLTNNSGATIALTSAVVSGTNAADFSTDLSGTDTIADGISQAVVVTFAPSAEGARSATLTISHDGGADVVISLAGTGTAAAAVGVLEADPTIVNVGNVINQDQGSATLTLNNTGTADLTLSGVAITGADAARFSTNLIGNETISAGGSITRSVYFAPTAIGAVVATLTISHDGNNGDVAVTLGGNGASLQAVLEASFAAMPAQVLALLQANVIPVNVQQLDGEAIVPSDADDKLTTIEAAVGGKNLATTEDLDGIAADVDLAPVTTSLDQIAAQVARALKTGDTVIFRAVGSDEFSDTITLEEVPT